MRLFAGNNACEKRLIVTPQFFDPAELAFIRQRAETSQAFRFVDVGANVGAYTVFAAQAGGTSGRVIAIDPNRRVLDRLAFNVAANGLATVTVVNVALGETEGTAEFAIDLHNMGKSSLMLEHAARQGKELIRVPVRPLLAVVEEAGFDHIDVLKVDVEGYEDRVLMPFLATAPEALMPAAVIIEDSSDVWQADLAGALRERGYVPHGHGGDNQVLVRR
jgi:FkbM family methyltransferase